MDLLSSSDKVGFASALGDIFDTFAKDIVIHKRPNQTVVSETSTFSPAYREEQPSVALTFEPISVSCKARVKYISRAEDLDKFMPLSESVKLDFGRTIIRLKIKPENLADIQDAIQVDVEGKSYEVVSTIIPKFTFSYQLYIVYVQEKK